MPLHILTLCTGNICRSPLAAQLLAARLNPAHFEVASAGTSPVIGEPMQEAMQRIATRLGAEGVSTHQAIGMTPHAVGQADLILGMDREHRRAAAKLLPNAARRCFTLLEFAHVVSLIDAPMIESQLQPTGDRALDALNIAMRMRGVVPRLSPDRLYDVPDPYGRSKQVYERAAKQIERAVDQIATFFYHTAALTEAATGEDATVTTPDSEYPK